MKKIILLTLFSAAILILVNAQIGKDDNKVGAASNRPKVSAENPCCKSDGNIQVKNKLTRWLAPEDNFLPIAAGTVGADPSADGALWISPLANSSAQKIGTGHYKVSIFNARITARSSIVVTPQSTTPKICTAKYVSPSVFEVYIFNTSGNAVDGGFNFIVNDPLNM